MGRVSILTVLIAIAPAIAARGDDALHQGPSRTLEEGMGVSLNGLGLQHTFDMEWKWALSSSRAPLHSDSHLSVGASQALTPAYARLGAWLEIAPLSVVGLRIGVEPTAYFGTFGSLMSFGNYRESFDDAARNARKAEARAGTGSRVYLSPTIRMKVGPIVAVSSAGLEWWRSSAVGPLYYEPSRDTLLKVGGDGVLTTSTMILTPLSCTGSLLLGVGHSLSYVWDAPENRSQKLGLIVARQFGPRRFGLNSPRVVGQVAYYLSDPSRKGLAVTTGISMRVGR